MKRHSRRLRSRSFLRVALLLAAALLLPERVAAVALLPGDAVVASRGTEGVPGNVHKIGPGTPVCPLAGDATGQTLISQGGLLSDPIGVALEESGHILVTDVTVKDASDMIPKLLRIDPATGGQEILSEGGLFQFPNGVAVNSFGEIYVADTDAGMIIQVDPVTGQQSVFASGGAMERPVDIDFESNGDLIVTDQGNNRLEEGELIDPRRILRLDEMTGSEVVVFEGGGLRDPQGIVVHPDGFWYVADAAVFDPTKRGLWRVNPVTGGKTQIVLNQGNFRRATVGLALESSGTMLLTDGCNPLTGQCNNSVARVDPETGACGGPSIGGLLDEPHHIAIVPAPEPAAAALGAAALATLAAVARSRRRR
jgi:sugar lactone lactonase YvrE